MSRVCQISGKKAMVGNNVSLPIEKQREGLILISLERSFISQVKTSG